MSSSQWSVSGYGAEYFGELGVSVEMFKNVICQLAVKTFGKKAQLIMLIEEMAELTQAISKYFRGNENKENIAEEIADVEIMLTQAKLIFSNNELVDEYTTKKLKRLAIKVDPPCEYKCFIVNDRKSTDTFITKDIHEVEKWCREKYENIQETELFGGEIADIFYYKGDKLKNLLLKHPELMLNIYSTRRDVENNNQSYTICILTYISAEDE